MRGWILCLTLAGCAHWPDEGQGGKAAEKTPWDSYLMFPAFQQQQRQLRRRTVDAQMGLDLLRLRGVMACLPARQLQAELLLARVRGDLAEGLYGDAAESLLLLEDQVHRLGVRLNHVTAKMGCGPSAEMAPAKAVAALGGEPLSHGLLLPEQFADEEVVLLPGFRTRLDRLALAMNANPGWGLTVTGHADHRGSEGYNQALGQRRARAVADHLISAGVDPERIRVASRGESDPVGDNRTATGRLANRRVTLQLTGQPGAAPVVIPLTDWDTESRRE